MTNRAKGKMLIGAFPPSWGSLGAFPVLGDLVIEGGTHMLGRLTPEWGSASSFQQLQQLIICDCTITITVTPTHCRHMRLYLHTVQAS